MNQTEAQITALLAEQATRWTRDADQQLAVLVLAGLETQRTLRGAFPCDDPGHARMAWEIIRGRVLARHPHDVHTAGTVHYERKELRWNISGWPKQGQDDFDDFLAGLPR